MFEVRNGPDADEMQTKNNIISLFVFCWVSLKATKPGRILFSFSASS